MKANKTIAATIAECYLACRSISDLKHRLHEKHILVSMQEASELHRICIPLRDTMIRLERYVDNSIDNEVEEDERDR